MHVRLYEIGSNRSPRVIYIDEFPSTICLDALDGLESGTNSKEHQVKIDEVDGQLIVDYPPSGEARYVLSNNRSEFEPLMPGDRINIASHQFVVSYDRAELETAVASSR